jgi:hypothetical protein
VAHVDTLYWRVANDLVLQQLAVAVAVVVAVAVILYRRSANGFAPHAATTAGKFCSRMEASFGSSAGQTARVVGRMYVIDVPSL